MKNYFLLFGLLISIKSIAQELVDTMPANKNVLIEEFTGVDCGSCPYGHQLVETLMSTYPNRVFATHMHSAAIGHVTPLNLGDESLSRPHADQVYSAISDLAGIPSGIVSRRNNNGHEAFVFFINSQYFNPIDSAVQAVMNEPSPLNIGVEALYDTISKELKVSSEVYTTNYSIGQYRLNVYLIQSNIFVTQDFGTWIPNYNQKRVFREVLTPTWGQHLSSIISEGDFFSNQHSFNNASTESIYKMQNMEVLVFVTDHLLTASPKGEVVQVMKAPIQLVGGGSVITGNNLKAGDQKAFEVFPNPSYDKECWIKLKNSYEDEVVYFRDIQGKIVYQENIGRVYAAYVDHQLPAGVYFVSLNSAPQKVERLVVH